MRYRDLPSAVLNFEFLVGKRVLVNPDKARTESVAKVLILSSSKPLNVCISITVSKSLNFTKRKTKTKTVRLYAKTPYMLLLFLCWLVLSPKLSFQSPLRSTSSTFIPGRHLGRAIKS